MGTWPKYFIASEEPQPLPALDESPLRFAVDVFRAAFPAETDTTKSKKSAASKPQSVEASEWIVATDAGAHLRLLSGQNRAQLPPELMKQLNNHELLAPTRTLNVKQLFLFDLEYAEAQGNPPGLNDPIHLHGRIFGPFPSEQPQWARGQLTVTRADVLEGMLRGAPCAFHYADAHRAGAAAHRCLHLLLPGAATQELESGEGAILAFPMLGTALSAGDPANQMFAAGLLYDVLAQLQADFLQENIRGAFPDLKLPVPSRRMHEAKLRARGHEIRGDTAYAPIGKPSRLWIGRLFQNLAREREKLPPEGTFADFARVARTALQALPGWPDGRAQTLQNLTRFHALTWRPGEDAMLRPVPITDREPHVATFQMDAAGVLSPAKPSNKSERFICFQVDPAFAFRRHADLDIQFEYQGGPGELNIDSFQDLPEPKGCWSSIVRMEAPREWKTASIAIPNTIIDRRFWHDADFAVVVRSKKDFRLRRLTITGRGAPSLEALPAPTTKSTSHQLKTEPGGLGWLRFLGRWFGNHMGPVLLFPRKPGFEITYDAYIADAQRKAADGNAFFVLKGAEGEHVFPARRTSYPEAAKHYGVDAYTHSGMAGTIAAESVPAGDYKAILRLVRPDGASCVEVDTARTVRFYDEISPQPGTPAEPPLSVEALGHHWAWGIETHGYDPCFRVGACSGSGEIGFRVWLKKDRGYQLAVGLMEPQVEERGHRLIELIVDGRTLDKYDLVAHPGTRRPYVVIAPACRPDSDGWVEIKVARHRDSKADHNVVIYGIWVFPEGELLTEESIARGTLTDKALLYWPCGKAIQRCFDEVLRDSLKHLEMKAGSTGQEITWQGRRVAREGVSDVVAMAAAFSVDQQLHSPAYDLTPAVQPERVRELLQRLRSASPYTMVALAISGKLERELLRELKDALRGWGIHVALPGESGARRNFLGIGVKGLAHNYAVELDGTEDLQFPPPPVPNGGLVGHWKLDDGIKKILDASGRKHHGAMKGGKWLNTPAGHVLEFDGSGYITIPYHADFHLPGDLTLMFWMRGDEAPERDVFMAGRGDPWRPALIWWRREHTVFTQGNRHGQGIAWARGECGVQRKWRHVAAVVLGHTVILYIDGAEAARDSRRGVPATTHAPFTIGGFENTWHPWFKGCMQDVRYYTRALSHDEILQIISEMPKERLIPAEPKRSRRKKKD